MKTFTPLLFFLLFPSCFSTYQLSNLAGTYYAVKIDKTKYEVTYEGEPTATLGYVKSMFLYRCAITALKAESAYFTILRDELGEISIATEQGAFMQDSKPRKTVEYFPGYYRTGIIQVFSSKPGNYDGIIYHAKEIYTSINTKEKSEIRTLF